MTTFTDFDSVQEGDTQSLVREIRAEDIRRFVEMTGDDNPLHVDPAYAETTPYKEVVVHGMLGASFLSTLIGTKLPGPGALWVSQSFDFRLPVRVGDALTVSAKVLRKHARDRLLELETVITNQHNQVVLHGQGKVKLLDPPKLQQASDARVPRVALITGGAGGIGRAIAKRLAADGHAVVIGYHESRERAQALVRELSAQNAPALAVRADLSRDGGAMELHTAACAAYGGVSVLVNGASPRIVPKSIDELRWGDVSQQLDVQVRAALAMVQACKPGMVAARHGRIINITSQALDAEPVAGWTAYALAKGCLAVFTRYLAAELGPSGITVNAVSPGMTDTTFISSVSEKQQLIAARKTPLRRLADPADIAAAVAYLASEGAAYVTGQTLRVNGGGAMPW